MKRSALVHLPPSVGEKDDNGKLPKLPLVINIHALESNAKGQKELSRFDMIADNCDASEQFIVAYPQGYSYVKLAPKVMAGFLQAVPLLKFQLYILKSRLEKLEKLSSSFLNDIVGLKSWNAGGCCVGEEGTSNIDDIAFFRELIKDIETNLAPQKGFILDKTQIYATGMSNGGFMTNCVACEMSDSIAAVAP